MLAVFQNVRQHCIAAAIGARFGKTDLDVVIAVFIDFCGGQTQSRLQFTRRARFILCAGADHRGEIPLNLLQNNLATGFQNALGDGIVITAQAGHLFQKLIGHLNINLCQR